MTITPAAAAMIREWLKTAERSPKPVENPVVYLLQASDTPAEMDEAIRRGAPKTEIAEIAGRVMPNMPRYLYPAIYPRSRFLWIFTTMISGFRFASPIMHPSFARRAMKKGVLDVAKPGLVLRDTDGTIVLPTPWTSAL